MVLTTILLATTVLDLTEGERQQLAMARDFGPLLDEAALYPLLKNAVSWHAGDETGAAVPNYPQIRADPAAHRGRLYLLKGKLIRSIGVPDFARPGPWEGRWQQWSIRWSSRPGDMAIVYLIEPPGISRSTRQVHLPARFYKIWRDMDQNGNETDFLVFVGRSARLLPTTTANPTRAVLLMVAALGLLMIYLFLRRKSVLLQPRPERRATHRPDVREERAIFGEPSSAPPLPENPAKALEALASRDQK